MRRLSIGVVVLTVFILILYLTDLSVDIATREKLVDSCNRIIEEEQLDSDTISCKRVVKIYLIREGIFMFLFGMIQVYFSRVVFRFARSMSSISQYPYPLSKDGDDLPPTYFVYASQGVPTADNWVPPPTYNGNPNNIAVTSDTKYAENAVNHA
ncbi:5569_t:CDS:2 [Ambispora gerdemannii]|uniref:5569_t:CDS:1 n=1 Tax=Ambispora gerdemannii TaxID=144530 RepID=A0A9N8W4J5_9GLOM|nr:5569_t:CDS:2 [Ambispora gerdemannii]